ncbi:hypothetical protein [Lusitaniella coriacea]
MFEQFASEWLSKVNVMSQRTRVFSSIVTLRAIAPTNVLIK